MRLTGTLRCAIDAEVQAVLDHLSRHIELTVAEPGCPAFEVNRTKDPRVWSVAEPFAGAEAFRAHQERVAASEWGRATRGIERVYTVSGLS